MATIRTNKAARQRFPRGSFASFRSPDDFPGCDLKVWRHQIDCNGRPEIGGYLQRYECDEAGNVIAHHDVYSEAQQAPLFLWVSVADVTRD